jgi:DNA polymerase-3 subunit delta'
MSTFAEVPEQSEAKRLLEAALAAAHAAGKAGGVRPGDPAVAGGRGEGPAHAYLLHGPPGVGKSVAAFAFAAALLGDARRVEARTHPDLYVLEPLGEMIRIDEVRALRHDLHMRPFEAERRVYVVLGAERMNEDAADALLKDLEEPPSYAVIVLVASELGPLPPTILSRCQLVPFRRLSERGVREWIAAQVPGRDETQVRALARAAAGRLDRARRLLDPAAAERRAALIATARAVYLDPDFEPADGAATILAAADARAQEAKEHEREAVESLEVTAREADQRVRRAAWGAEREELLAGLEGLEAWYRDLVVVAAGAEQAAIHADRLDELRADAALGLGEGPERAAESVREVWRALEEFNLNASLAFEALFVRLRRDLRASVLVP